MRNISRLKHGDTVEVNVRGRVFRAKFVGTTPEGDVRIVPPTWCSYHHVAKRDVKKKVTFNPATTQHKG